MKQVLVKKGRAIPENVPAPQTERGTVLVKVVYSCISAGTEMEAVKDSGTPLIKRAMKQPENVKKVVDMVKEQGIANTLNTVKRKVEAGTPMGYSASGIILEVGEGVNEFKVGDRVACAGAGIANHAEYIIVPKNLCMKLPEGLDYRSASSVALGAISMQGVRRADLRLGEYAAVIGMGIMGQLVLQMLKASGCKVITIDLDERRLAIAKNAGADLVLNPAKGDVVTEVMNFTGFRGVDAAIITAATSSNEPLSQAFRMCKRRGRVVLVGVIGNQFERGDMYKKELDFLISTSYGPGRYDDDYEQRGIDYPYAYVRWTEKRNMDEYLWLLKERKIVLDRIIEKEFPIDQSEQAFDSLKTSAEKPLMVLLNYGEPEGDLTAHAQKIERRIVLNETKKVTGDKINVALVGAGGFAKGMHLPNLKKLPDIYNIYAIMSATGSNAKAVAQQYGAKYATTDYQEILNDPDVHMVLICTRHDLHAQMAAEAIKRGKAVLVEKPMAVNRQGMQMLVQALDGAKAPFMVGFNRRFSKYAVEAKRHVKDRLNPLIINYRMNVGYIPLDHWVHSEEGGGRIIGEGCHIFDLFNYFTESEVESVSVNSINPNTEHISCRDNVVATVKYKDGSICTLTYTAIGSKDFPKEYCEIYFDGKVITIDDYKALNGYSVKVNNPGSKTSEKGQYEELVEFAKCIKEGTMPIPVWQLVQATEISFLVDEELKNM